jgi:dihydrofolate reductase
MRKIVAGLAMSLDGVVERPSEWMSFGDEAQQIMAAGLAEADTVLLGRRTYREFAGMWPQLGDTIPMAGFLNGSPKYVMSSEPIDLGWPESTRIDLDGLVKLKAQPGRNILVPGSPRLVASLLRAGLLDELAVMIPPVVVGGGQRLFEDGFGRMDLEVAESRILSGGILAATYSPRSGKMG